MNRLLIIPAAGLGSRLQSETPKALIPVGGRPMIDHLFDLYAPVVDCIVLTLNPTNAEAARRHCEGSGVQIEYALQEYPTGMLDAILIPQERVRELQPEQVWITWCDQIAVHPQTVSRLAETVALDRAAAVVMPTIIKQEPYIHFARNSRGEIVDVLQRREGDLMPERGEGDIGLFCLSRQAYLDLLPRFASEAMSGGATRERNFLPFIPWVAGRATVLTFPAHAEIESVGVNTLDDLSQIEDYLRHGK